MNQEKSSVTVKNSIPSPTDLTQAAVARPHCFAVIDAGRRGANTKSICENIRNDSNSDREIKSAAYPFPGRG